MKPLCIDLFCGLGGWAEGFLAEGYEVIGFDTIRRPYPGDLVLQDVLTLDGCQFADATILVASPPCQAYSYRAMPWSRAKSLPPPDNSLFEACFRIQSEASVIAGRHIPLIVENVRGAQKWVGRARWHFGSFYLFGDVPALMPTTKARKRPGRNFHANERGETSPAFNGALHETRGVKTFAHANQRDGFTHTRHLTNQTESDAVKVGGDWFGDYAEQKAAGTISPGRLHGKGSNQRAQASALIAKIPFPLASHIARVFKGAM